MAVGGADVTVAPPLPSRRVSDAEREQWLYEEALSYRVMLAAMSGLPTWALLALIDAWDDPE